MPWRNTAQYVDDNELIEAVKSRSPIYDKDDKNHCNRDLISSLWAEIAAEVGCDALLCKGRWTSMRDYFMKKYREERLIGPLQRRKRKWFLYDSMSFLKTHVRSSELLENIDGVNNSDTVDNVNYSGKCGFVNSNNSNMVDNVNGTGIEYDSTDESEMAIPSPAGNQSNQTRRQQVFQGSKRKREEDSEASVSNLGVIPGHPATRSEASYYRRGNDTDDSSIEVKLNTALTKVLRDPSDNYHDLFFRSLIPMISSFDNMETVQFRTEVLELVFKYLQRRQTTMSGDSQRK